jgi:hypothetical protein
MIYSVTTNVASKVPLAGWRDGEQRISIISMITVRFTEERNRNERVGKSGT